MIPFLQIVNQATALGYTAQQILNFVGGKIPKMLSGINNAKSQGYSPEQILRFLSNKMPVKKENIEKSASQNAQYLEKMGIKTREQKEETRNKFIKGALGTGAALFTAYNMGSALMGAGASALSQAATQAPQGTPPSPTPQQPPAIQGQILPAQAQQAQGQVPQLPQTQSQAPMSTAPKGMQSQSAIAQQAMNPPHSQPDPTKMLPKPQANDLATSDEEAPELQPPPPPQEQANTVMPSPEIQQAATAQDPIAEQQAVIEANPMVKNAEDAERTNAIEFNELQARAKPGTQRTLFQETARKLQKAGKIKDTTEFGRFKKWWNATEGKGRGPADVEYDLFKRQTKGMFDEQKPQEQKKLEPKTENVPAEIAKNTVMLPNGDIGEKVSSHKGVTTVDVDGKKLQYKDIDLEDPVAVRNVIHQVAQISEKERSGPMDLAQYNPKDKQLFVQFKDGKVAVYLDVEPDIADKIQSATGKPKTTGRTKTGESWIEAVPESRGADLNALITKNPKYNKASQGVTWYFLEEVYDKYSKIREISKKERAARSEAGY